MKKLIAQVTLGIFLFSAVALVGLAKGGPGGMPAGHPGIKDKAVPAQSYPKMKKAATPAKPEGKAVRKNFRKKPKPKKKQVSKVKKHKKQMKKQKKQGVQPAKPLHPGAVPATPPATAK